MNSNQQLNSDEHPSTIKVRQSILIKLPIALSKQFLINPRFLQALTFMSSRSTNNYLCTRHPEMPLCVCTHNGKNGAFKETSIINGELEKLICFRKHRSFSQKGFKVYKLFFFQVSAAVLQ
ncbi:hypothetical protein CEXT_179431 [Caerostris extrusa]|uniref:Uncharacterized protein n=1 Tax=Caerostris extrusa TaxID=172846 RepID=A0AAV4Y2F4_CAEEX|nr:hypothetical protein CEXT_179431 [Caerostris extrusa]